MSAGSAFGMLAAITITGILALVLGAAMYIFVSVAPSGGSQDGVNGANFMVYGMLATVIIFLILCVVNHFINSKNEQNQQV